MAIYKAKEDITLNGEPVIKEGDTVDGVLSPDETGALFLFYQNGDVKVKVPEMLLEEVAERNASGPDTTPTTTPDPEDDEPFRVHGAFAIAGPAVGLGAGIYVGYRRGGGWKNYVGFGFLGLAVGSIPTIFWIREQMTKQVSTLANAMKGTSRGAYSRAPAKTKQLVDSANLLAKTTSGKDLPVHAKDEIARYAQQSSFTPEEDQMLQQYITLSNAVQLNEQVTSRTPQEQKNLETTVAKVNALHARIEKMPKLKKFIAFLKGGENGEESGLDKVRDIVEDVQDIIQSLNGKNVSVQ